jgi:hypothetical protein
MSVHGHTVEILDLDEIPVNIVQDGGVAYLPDSSINNLSPQEPQPPQSDDGPDDTLGHSSNHTG